MRARLPAFVLVVAAISLAAPVARSQSIVDEGTTTGEPPRRPPRLRPPESPGLAAAESLRRHLDQQRALPRAVAWGLGGALGRLYATRSIEKPPGCPLQNFQEQPATALSEAVNLFTVRFDQAPAQICHDAPPSGNCLAIVDSCVTIGTSIFCDQRYLARRVALAEIAYHDAWNGLKGVSDGRSAAFIATPHDALVDLARMSQAARQAVPDPPDLQSIVKARWLAANARSSVYDLARSVSLMIPILHEVAHVEQSYCGRGVATEGKDDFVGRLMLTGKRDYQASAKLYEMLTCSRLARNELDADLRSVDMLLRYLEDEAPAARNKPDFAFSPAVDDRTRSEVRGLARWSREVALLTVLHGTEYDLLIHGDPMRGLSLVRGEPRLTKVVEPYTTYYLTKGDDPTIPRVRGHLEPALRSIHLAESLDVPRLYQVNLGKTIVITHVRAAPYAMGRLMTMRRNDCGVRDTNESSRALSDYVMAAYQGVAAPATGSSKGGEAEIDKARALLARFVEPGADRVALSRKLRPTPADYRAVFEDGFAARISANHEAFWEKGELLIDLAPEQTELLVSGVSSDDLRRDGGSKGLPGGYRNITGLIRPGITIYGWRFVEPGKKFGVAYDGLYFLNGRWFWIPKPYRVE